VSFKRYRVSFERKDLVSVEVVAESKAQAKRIAADKEWGEKRVLGTHRGNPQSVRIINEEPCDPPGQCKGCGQSVGTPHEKACPYWKPGGGAGHDLVQHIHARIAPV
jgi:hypothetical protein